MTRTVLALCVALATTACGGGNELRDPSGKYRLIAQVHEPELGAALRQHDDIALVVSLDVGARDVAATVQQAIEGGRPLVVAIGRKPEQVGDDAADALVIETTGAEAVIDLALLAANGIAIPQTRIPIGTRIITRADAVAGGERFAAPGDFVLQMLRQQHRDALQPGGESSFSMLALTPPAADVARSALADAALQLSDELLEAAGRHPQIDLMVITGDGRGEGIAPELARRPCKAVIALVDGPDSAQRIRQQCGEVPLVLIDPQGRDLGTTTVSCPPEMLGRALADAVRKQLPGGGALLTVANDERSARTIAIRQAFLAALELKKP